VVAGLLEKFKAKLPAKQAKEVVYKVAAVISTYLGMAAPESKQTLPAKWVSTALGVALDIDADGIAVISISFGPPPGNDDERRRLKLEGRRLDSDGATYETQITVDDIDSGAGFSTMTDVVAALSDDEAFMTTLANAVNDPEVEIGVVTAPKQTITITIVLTVPAGSTDMDDIEDAIDGVETDAVAALAEAGVEGVTVDVKVVSSDDAPSSPPPAPPGCTGENPTFKDAGGFACDQWESSDCGDYPSYTAAEMAALITACPICCAGSSEVVASPPAPPSCTGENPTFKDSGGYTCDDWESSDCGDYSSYTAAEMAALITACPICCAGSSDPGDGSSSGGSTTPAPSAPPADDDGESGGLGIGPIIGIVVGVVVLVVLASGGAYIAMSKKAAAAGGDYGTSTTQHV